MCHLPGKKFQNKDRFGQFPLQVGGFADIHESLEGATAQGQIEAVNCDVTSESGQEVDPYTSGYCLMFYFFFFLIIQIII